MIARLRGELIESANGFVVVLAGGVGYQVSVTERCLVTLPSNGNLIELHTRQIVRESEISLYGFSSAAERRMFDLLITVNGMGPRSALALLGTLSEGALVAAISTKDYKPLTRAPGVGPKLAERVCLELNEKVREESLLGNLGVGAVAVQDDIVEALISLGLRRNEAERAAAAAREQIGDEDAQKLIPAALALVGKNP